MEAIEYYAAIEGDGEEKHQYFQEKLRKLLSNEAVHNKVQREIPKEQSKTQKIEATRPEGASSHRFNHKKQMELNLIMGERKAQDMTKEMLKNFNVSQNVINKLVKTNLSTQEEEIAKRIEKRKQARSQSQSKLMLKSPALSVNTDEISPLKLPMTPRAPTSNDDPYGLKAQKQTEKFDSDIKENGESNLIAKSEPVSKGKANFFSRLKKSAKPLEKTSSLSKPDIKIQITAFEADDQPLSQDIDLSNLKILSTSQGGQSVDPMDSPFLEKPKKSSAKKSKFKLAVITNHTNSPEPKKSPRRVVLDVNLDEELDALKEELEVFEIQLEGEEDEAAKVDWITEIERVTEAIVAKEEEISNKKIADKTRDAAEVIETPTTLTDKPQDGIEGSDKTNKNHMEVTYDKASDQIAQNLLTNDESIQDEAGEADKKSDMPDDEDKSPSKPKKKSSTIFILDAMNSLMSKLKNKSKKEA